MKYAIGLRRNKIVFVENLMVEGQELADAVRRLESGRAPRLEDEKQLSELHFALSKKNVELEALKVKIANVKAEKVWWPSSNMF